MSIIDDVISELENFEFGGNNGVDFAIALLVVILSIFFFYILKFVILRKFKTWLRKQEKLININTLLEGVDRTINFPIIFLFSIYLGLQGLETSPVLKDAIKVILLITVSYFLMKLSFVLVDYLITFQSKYVEKTSTSIIEFFRLVLKTIMVIILVLWFLSNLNVDTTAFLASLGIFALAIAFALQNVIEDIFASLTIYLDRPFTIGDTIVVGGDMGTVEKIGIRSTRLRTLQGHMLIVSNRELINTKINNYQRMQRRRVPFTIGVHASTHPNTLREIPNMMKELISEIDGIEFNRTYLTNLGSSSIDFEIVYFVQSRSYSTYLRKHEEVILRIIDKFDEENIVIPYPTQKILVEKEEMK